MKKLFQSTVLVIVFLSLQSFTPSSKNEDVTVYICDKGKVYHSKKSCRGLKNAKSKIKAMSLEEVKKDKETM